MNKALKVLILSLTTYCLWGGMSANAATVHQFSATDAGKLQKPDTMVVMKDVTVVGNRQHDFQMRTSVNNINIDRSYFMTILLEVLCRLSAEFLESRP